MRETKDINFLTNQSTYVDSDGEKKKQSISSVTIAIAVVVVLLAVAVILIPNIYLKSLQGQVSTLEGKIADTKYAEINLVKGELANINQNINTKKSIIHAIDNKGAMASQSLIVVKQAMLPNCYLTSFSFSGGNLKIGIKAENSLIASEFMGNLDRLSLLTRTTDAMSYSSLGSDITYSLSYNISETE